MSPTGIGMRQTHFEAKDGHNTHSPVSRNSANLIQSNSNNIRNKVVSKGIKEGIAKQVGMVNSPGSNSTGLLGKYNIDSS